MRIAKVMELAYFKNSMPNFFNNIETNVTYSTSRIL